jgi:hypothetical protein
MDLVKLRYIGKNKPNEIYEVNPITAKELICSGNWEYA